MNFLPCSILSSRVRADFCGVAGERRMVATATIAAGCLVAVFGGQLRSGCLVGGASLQPFPLQVEEDAFLWSANLSPARWIGHACEPNTGLVGAVSLVALKEILPGQPIAFDYGTCLGSSAVAFDCACGRPLCRGRITGEDWRRPDLWARYEGYFSPYLGRRIDAISGIYSSRFSSIWPGRTRLPASRRPARAMPFS